MKSSSSSTSASITMSDSGLQQQAKTLFSSRSMSIKAKEEASPISKKPSVTCTLHVPQVPCPQAKGSQTPWRNAASRMV